MEFGPSASQQLLRESVARFLAKEATLERVRSTMATESGLDRPFHRALGELGALDLLVPEASGGGGLGLFEASLVAQELGAAVAPISFHSSAVLAPLLLLECGNEQQQQEHLPRWSAGESLATVCFMSGDRDPGIVSKHRPNSEFVTGRYAADGQAADTFLLVRGEEVFVVGCGEGGLNRTALLPIDETRRFAEVAAEPSCFVAANRLERRLSPEALDRCLQAARIALAADTLGAALRSIRLAVEYARERRQFGRIIGSYQAVKHLCAEMIAEVDPVQSLVWYAAYAWDQGLADSAWLAPQAKALAAEVCSECVTKATQVFGGIGFTWECDMHLFFKRVGYGRLVLGRPEELRRRAAELQFGLAGASAG